MPRRAGASSARLDKLKHVPRGDSPALACGPPRAMKLSLTEFLQVPLRTAHQANHLIEEAGLTL